MKRITVIVSAFILQMTFFTAMAICSGEIKKNDRSNATNQSKKARETKTGEKQTSIDGIGSFKIGITDISVIDDLEKELNTKRQVVNDPYPYRKYEERYAIKIYEVVPKDKTAYPGCSICPDVNEYLIPFYNIADMQIEMLRLKFYKNLLYQIGSNSDKTLDEALELKYGQPKINVEKKAVACVYKLTGNKVALEEKTFTSSWVNGNILATITFHNFFDDKCKPLNYKIFRIIDKNTAKLEMDCESNIRTKQNDIEKQERLKKLKNF